MDHRTTTATTVPEELVGIVYAYHEADSERAANLRFFLTHAYIAGPGHVFVVVVNGGVCSVDLSGLEGVTRVDRENTGMDFGAYAAGLEHLRTRGIRCTQYVFLNASCRGPFIPPYARGRVEWPTVLTGLLTADTKLVGPTINVVTMPFAPDTARPHVQSYCFAMDSACMEHLTASGFWRDIPDTYHRVVVEKEIGMSEAVLRRGWNIGCLVPEYGGHDYRDAVSLPRPFNPAAQRFGGDILFDGKLCFGRDVHPYEVVFIKTNRDISTHEVVSLTRALGGAD